MFSLLQFKKEKDPSHLYKKDQTRCGDHGCSPSSWEVETGGPAVQRLEASPAYRRPCLKKKKNKNWEWEKEKKEDK